MTSLQLEQNTPDGRIIYTTLKVAHELAGYIYSDLEHAHSFRTAYKQIKKTAGYSNKV